MNFHQRSQRQKKFMDQKTDWQIVGICFGFVIEVNCNGGGHRRVVADGRIEYGADYTGPKD